MKPRPRLLNLNVDELQNFANALHNQSRVDKKKGISDLSDVNLDEDDEEPQTEGSKIPDKFFSNLQAPFHPMITVEEMETCKENGVDFKVSLIYK